MCDSVSFKHDSANIVLFFCLASVVCVCVCVCVCVGGAEFGCSQTIIPLLHSNLSVCLEEGLMGMEAGALQNAPFQLQEEHFVGTSG